MRLWSAPHLQTRCTSNCQTNAPSGPLIRRGVFRWSATTAYALSLLTITETGVDPAAVGKYK
jgi:hypothetical protein